MFVFQDLYQNEVHLSFSIDPFCNNPKHVWVICRYNGQWLLTKHKERGLEFPGGKVESGETANDAAIREVMEETGAIVSELTYLGQYKVLGKGKTIIKNIYFAEIESLTNQTSYFETFGPILLQDIPLPLKKNNQYSFIMKDNVLIHSLEQVEKLLSEKE
ncbi:RNA deprotection pyrophosphohydrolase [Bacillus sp. PS06]|uniref:RNA deprotection pyrophosphohydrolase n=1 Tax=Bacillus sp. PS06 TaxID=2764176 RepID=UPI001783BCBC|nr:nucleoside triphosphatase YtkD [Bacillus sp. PS06]MBD8068571.1 nucleoside triphosphatase YtkD [Bacillus sp. PS06]